MDTYIFRVIGRPSGPDFLCYGTFRNAADIECVHGVTRDGKLQTTARFVDVIWANHIAPKAS